MSSVLTELGGFTPVIDVVTEDVGLMTSVVFGLVWRHCQMKDKVCKKSVSELAEILEVSPRTVRRHLEKLCKHGYIKDMTPDLRNKPHIYIDTGKVKIVGKIEAELSESRYDTKSQQNPTMTQSHSEYDTESQQVGQRVTATVTQSPMSKTRKPSEKTGETPPQVIPAYKIFIDITNYHGITDHWLSEMGRIVGANPDDLDFWRKVVIGWTGKYRTKHNVEGMLDYYKRREIPGHNGNGHALPKPPSPKIDSPRLQRLRAEDQAQIFNPLGERHAN